MAKSLVKLLERVVQRTQTFLVEHSHSPDTRRGPRPTATPCPTARPSSADPTASAASGNWRTNKPSTSRFHQISLFPYPAGRVYLRQTVLAAPPHFVAQVAIPVGLPLSPHPFLVLAVFSVSPRHSVRFSCLSGWPSPRPDSPAPARWPLLFAR